MSYARVPLAARASAGWCVALLGFTIPLSAALDGILLGLVLLAWTIAIAGLDRAWLRAYFEIKPAFIGALLFIALLVSATYSTAEWNGALEAACRYVDLALIPVFAWAATMRAARRRAVYAFAAAIVLSLAVSFAGALHVWEAIPGFQGRADPPRFKLSLTYSLLIALAAFVFLVLARELRGRWRWAALGLGAACIFNALFVAIGRTGYVVLAALLLYAACTGAPQRRGVLVGLLLVTSLFASAYFWSSSFPTRVLDAASDLTQWRLGADNLPSVGQRAEFYATTLEIIRDHPWTGVGAGGFTEAYSNRMRGLAAPATTNPHNDYLMVAAQAGIPAVMLLIALYIVLWRAAPQLGSRLERDIMRGLVLTIALGGLFNTLLMDHVEGLIFAWGIGLLYGGKRVERRVEARY